MRFRLLTDDTDLPVAKWRSANGNAEWQRGAETPSCFPRGSCRPARDPALPSAPSHYLGCILPTRAAQLGGHASVHVQTAEGTGNGCQKDTPVNPQDSQSVAVPRVILTFVSVCVIFINRLTHRPSPSSSDNWGPECLLSTFPAA